MRSELIYTHFRCNQRCTYCTTRRTEDERAYIHPGAVRARIDAALGGSAKELVFSGGEPTMRGDLEALFAYARAAGAERVVLETNATLLDEARVRALVTAGMTHARVNLTAWGTTLDAITQDAGGAERTLTGLRSLLAQGVPVTLCAVLVRATLESVPELPRQLAETLGDLSGIQLLSVRVPVEAPDARELVSYEEAAETLSALDSAARTVGLTVKLAPDSGPPPCVFSQTGRTAQLFALTPGARARAGYEHPPVCEGCLVNRSCVGLSTVYLQHFPLPEMKPVTEDRVRRRLSLITTVEEQIRRELSQPNRFPDRQTGQPVIEQLIRVNFHCNQACAFCFVSTHLPPATDQAVREEILKAARERRQVTLTGGEPTLNPRLAEYVTLALANGAPLVALQTNAIKLEDQRLTDKLVDAGVRWVQVSLHGSYAALSDAMTEAPGTFDHSVLGIDALHRHAEVYLSINFVITQNNHHDLLNVVELVARRWPRAFLNISFVGASSDVVPKEKWLVPRYSEVMASLSGALARARELGVDVGGFESMCGIPLCLVDANDRLHVLKLAEIPADWDGGEFVHPDACQRCALKTRCYGLRRGYFGLYGDAELQPVAVSEAQP